MDRLPPHSILAEEAVIGSIIIDPDAIVKLAAILRPEQFYREAHAIIYRTALELHEMGTACDFITLSTALQERGLLDSTGGANRLVGLADRVVTAAHAEHYADIIAENHRRRQLIAFAGKSANAAYADEPLNMDTLYEEFQEITTTHDGELRGAMPSDQFVKLDLNTQEPVIGEGLLPYHGRLIFAGAPKLGKSILVMQMALELSHGSPIWFQYPVARPWRVLYLDFEWADKISQDRLLAMNKVYQVNPNLWVGSLSPVDILAAGGIGRIAKQVQAAMPRCSYLIPYPASTGRMRTTPRP